MCRTGESCHGSMHDSGDNAFRDFSGAVTSPVTNGDLNTIWVLNPDPDPQSFTVDIEIR